MKRSAWWFVILLISLSHSAHGQTLGTNFTYQGQLKQAGAPLNSTADFEFRLFNALSGGEQVGSTDPVSNVNVVNGLFTVSLDFGAVAFNGDQRWLEIRARSPAGGGNFTTLTPRQPLAAAPYALYALTGPGSGGPWAVNGSNVFNTNTGNVGIGTTSPVTPLHLRHEEPVMILQDPGTASQQSGYLGFWNGVPQETGWVGFGTPGSPTFSMVNARSAGDIQLIPGPSGAVTVPAGGVEVVGNVRLGSSAQLFAPGGEENLRVIRGRVNSNGAIHSGAGFSAVQTAEGQYAITFDTPFPVSPTMIGSAEVTLPSTGFNMVMFDTINGSQVNVYLSAHNGSGLNNGAFHFIAVGLR
jgi:hypothetical protein